MLVLFVPAPALPHALKALKDAGLAPNFVERCLLMDLEAFGAAVNEVQL